MSGKAAGFEGSDGGTGEDVRLPYPEISALPDVGKIMKDLGIESTITQGTPESSSTDELVKPGGLGFEGFLGRLGEDVGFPTCETSGEFPNVEKIMKDLNIESPTSQGTPENTTAASKVLESASHLFDVGFKEDILNQNLSNAVPTTSEKTPAVDDVPKKAEAGQSL